MFGKKSSHFIKNYENIYTVIKTGIYQKEYKSFTSLYKYFLSSIIQMISSYSMNINACLGSIKKKYM